MAAEYPWYDLVEEAGELLQGDLLMGCPVIAPIPDLKFPIPDGPVEAVKRTFDIILITQSCDLANEKVSEVLCCPHWDLEKPRSVDISLATRSTQQAILKGRRHRYALLAGSDKPEMNMGTRLVDFGQIFNLPKDFARQVAENQRPRLRLRPPYREYLSQAFARFYMRIALPQEIELK